MGLTMPATLLTTTNPQPKHTKLPAIAARMELAIERGAKLLGACDVKPLIESAHAFNYDIPPQLVTLYNRDVQQYPAALVTQLIKTMRATPMITSGPAIPVEGDESDERLASDGRPYDELTATPPPVEIDESGSHLRSAEWGSPDDIETIGGSGYDPLADAPPPPDPAPAPKAKGKTK